MQNLDLDQEQPSAIVLFLYRNQKICAFVGVCLTILLSIGNFKLTFNGDHEVFFSKEDPYLKEQNLIKERFVQSDGLMLIIAPKNKNIFTRDNLQLLSDLTDQLWQTPHSTRVDSLINHQHSYANEDELVVESLFEQPSKMSPQAIEQGKKIALNERVLVNRLISKDGAVASISIALDTPKISVLAFRDVLNFVEPIVEQIEKRYPVDIYLLGAGLVNETMIDVGEHDQRVLVPLMFLLMSMALYWFFRSVKTTLLVFVLIGVSVSCTMGVVGWLELPINVVTNNVPLIVMTLAIADAVHILVAYLKAKQMGLNEEQANLRALSRNLKPIVITTFTTAVGLLGMNTSASPPFREFGNFSSLGVILALVMTMLWLPYLISAFAISSRRDWVNSAKVYQKLNHFIAKHYQSFFYSIIVLLITCLAFIPFNELNDDNIGYFSKDAPIRIAAEFANENITGVDYISWTLDTGESQGIYRPDKLQAVESFSNWLRTQEDVIYVMTFTDVLKRLNKNMNGEREAFYQLPEQRDLTAQYVLLYEMSLPFGMDLQTYFDIDRRYLKVTALLESKKANDFIRLENLASDYIDQVLPQLKHSPGGTTLMFSHIGLTMVKSMLLGSAAAFLLVFFAMLFTFKSFKHALLSMLPNLAPAMITLGVWGALVSEVNMGVAVIFSITIGLIVDDTVHFLTKYFKGYDQFGDVKQALDMTFDQVGSALMTTTTVLVSGFLILTLSDFAVNQDVGVLVAMTLSVALLFDFLFLPSALYMWEKNRSSSRA